MTAIENVPASVPNTTRVIDTARASDASDPSLDLLTVSEVAAMLRLSKMTIYRLMDQGSLPALRVGRSFRIPRNSVRSLVEASSGKV